MGSSDLKKELVKLNNVKDLSKVSLNQVSKLNRNSGEDEVQTKRHCGEAMMPSPTSNSSTDRRARRHEKKELKMRKHIKDIKVRSRSELGLYDWCKQGYHLSNLWIPFEMDALPRIDYETTSRQQFIDLYESQNLPVIIEGITKLWPASRHWNSQMLKDRFRNQMFKIGEDDEGDNVYIQFKHYVRYSSSDQAKTDDSPLYIFDSNFSKNPKFKRSDKDKEDKKINEEIAKVDLLSDFFVPKYFDCDLFHLTGDRRPPYRWFVMGGARSGTNIHIDPLGTSAWNALVQGHKRWAMFPPNTNLAIVDPPLKKGDREGISWFAKVYPKFQLPATVSNNLTFSQFGDPVLDPTLGSSLKMRQAIQRPGETIFVPGGWAHVVVNLDDTIAITQNFCSPTSFEYVYLKTRNSRPKLAKALISKITKLADPSKPRPTPYDQHPPGLYQSLVGAVPMLATIPQLYSSSDSGSSTSSTDLTDASSTEDSS